MTQDLSSLVYLDICAFDIFDFAPLNQYELFIRNYGNSGCGQMATQTSDDNVAISVQTEDWDVVNKWTEAPPNQFQESGTDHCRLDFIAKPKESKRKDSIIPIDADAEPRFLDFLRSSCRVVEALLEEEYIPSFDEKFEDIEETLDFVTGSSLCEHPTFLLGNEGKIYYTASGIIISWICKGKTFDSHIPLYKTVIGIYKAGEVHARRFLVCYPEVTSCILVSQGGTSIVAAATKDGSIQLWDINESVSHEISINQGDKTWKLKQPDYITDGRFDGNVEKHEFPIVAIFQNSDTLEDQRDVTTKLLSLDQSGVMITWVLNF